METDAKKSIPEKPLLLETSVDQPLHLPQISLFYLDSFVERLISPPSNMVTNRVVNRVNARYETWRENMQTLLTSLRETASTEEREGVDQLFKSNLLTPASSPREKLLQMLYVAHHYRPLQSNLFPGMAAHSWKKAAQDYTQAQRFFSLTSRFQSLNLERVMGALALEIPVNHCPLSFVDLYVSMAQARRIEVYKKSDMLASLPVEIPRQDNDLHVEHPFIDSTRTVFAAEAFYLSPPAFAERLDNLMQQRLDLLSRGAMYLKPYQGANATGIIRMEYDGTTLSLQTTIPDLGTLLRILADQKLYDAVYEKKIEYLRLLPAMADNGSPGEDIGEVYVYEGENQEISIEDLDLETPHINLASHPFLDGGSTALYFLHGLSVNQEDTQIKVTVPPERLDNVLLGLEAIYLGSNTCSYAERALNIPRIEGKTWEIRVINIAQGPTNATPKAMYVKMGENDFVANISRGGKGRAVEDVVQQAYQSILPSLPATELNRKVAEYLTTIQKYAQQTVHSLSGYFTTHMREHGIPYPFSSVPVDNISTDFIAEVDTDAEGSPTLVPHLTDTNLYFGYSGLAECSPSVHQDVRALLIKKEQEIKRFVEKYHRKF